MTTCEELDQIHKDMVAIAITTYVKLAPKRTTSLYPWGYIPLRSQMVSFSTQLHEFLLGEGVPSYYCPGAESRQFIHIEGPLYIQPIGIAIHPLYPTLIYLRGDPYLGTIQELLADIRKSLARQESSIYCSSCHYFNKDLYMCGQGLQLTQGCRQYKPTEGTYDYQ